MKCLRKKRVVLCLLICNIIFVIVLYCFLQTEKRTETDSVKKKITFTVIIREFEEFDHDVPQTIRHIHAVLGNDVPVFIVTNKLIFPKLNLSNSDVQSIFNLDFEMDGKISTDAEILSAITSDLVIFLPDGTRIYNRSVFDRLIEDFYHSKFAQAFAMKTGNDNLKCPGMHINLQRWRMKFTEFDGSEGLCDYIEGDQAIIIRTETLSMLPSPWTVPLSWSIYMQLVVRRWKSFVYTPKVFVPMKGFKYASSMKKFQHEKKKRENSLLRKFKIKEVVYKIDADHEKNVYYGCIRDSEHCYSFINNIPDFLHRGKWTPPCCLKALRETAEYVFNVLSNSGMRYWLEGGSLLGAARSGDIIPWDISVDIGIYMEDIPKCQQLVKTGNFEFLDEKGFLWEKAEEGEFYRVFYSITNRNYLQIFPFYPKNGMMTKDFWFKSHSQDIEFPEHFLKPLSTIAFIGRNVSAPNHVQEFLDLKFGQGAIDNPKYPNGIPVY